MYLPFLLLVFFLAVVAGYGGLFRMRADAGARLAGTVHVRTAAVEATAGRRASRFGRAEAAARRAVGESYFSAVDPDRLELDVRVGGAALERSRLTPGEDGLETDSGETFGLLEKLWANLNSRTNVEMRIPRQPPLGRSLLPSSPVSASFRVDGTTWIWEEAPLGLELVTEDTDLLAKKKEAESGLSGIVAKVVDATLGNLFRLLGMIA